jgi:AP2 domain
MEIELTQGKVAVIDDADWAIVAPYKWHASCSRRPLKWYATTRVGAKNIPMHMMITGNPMTDHRDGNGLDNRRHNLRSCNNQQNQFNRRKPRMMAGRPTSSRFKGASWAPRRNKWLAQIQHNHKTKHLGYHDSEEAAARAYDAAASGLFGEFARLNFPTARPLAT